MVEIFDMSLMPNFCMKLGDQELDGRARFSNLADAFSAVHGLIAVGILSRDEAVIKVSSSVLYVLSEVARKKVVLVARKRGGSFMTITLRDDMTIEQWYHSDLETGELQPIAQIQRSTSTSEISH